jgi:hypothetical protein
MEDQARPDWKASGDHMVRLNQDNFNVTVLKERIALVMFYDSSRYDSFTHMCVYPMCSLYSCYICKRISTDLRKAATRVAGTGVMVGRADCAISPRMTFCLLSSTLTSSLFCSCITRRPSRAVCAVQCQ